MSKETLKKLRILVPGCIIVLIIFYLSSGDFGVLRLFEEFKATQFLITIILGSLYYSLDIRDFFWKRYKAKVDDKITKGLLEPFKGLPKIDDKYDKLVKSGDIKQIFWHYLDKDPSLQVKVQNVYFNGIFWSSSVDLLAISAIGIPICLIVWIISKWSHWGIMIMILLIIFLIAWFILIPSLTRKHLKLANRQIQYIHVIHMKDLKKRILSRC